MPKKKKVDKPQSEPITESFEPPPPSVQREVLIDPNLFAGKAMLLIDAIEQEIQQGHLPEWKMVADRLEKAIKTLRAMPDKREDK